MSEGLAQGAYVAARAGFELTTLWTKGVESTNEPTCPTSLQLNNEVVLIVSAIVKSAKCWPFVSRHLLSWASFLEDGSQSSIGYNYLMSMWYEFDGNVMWFKCTANVNVKFIHSGHFYSASSSPLLLRGATDYSTDTTVSEFHAKAHRQLQVKDLPKVPTWWLERESNPRPSGWKSSSQPRRHHIPCDVI